LKKILFTGSKGDIGQFLLKKLRREYKVYTINSDLTKKIPKILNIDYVLHFAGTVKPKDNFKDPIKVFENNIISTLNLINSLKKLKKKPIFIFASSSQVANDYLNFKRYKKNFDEKIPLMLTNNNPQSSYGYSKIFCEKIVQMSGLNYTILRIFNIYGIKKKNDFFNDILDQIKSSKEIKIYNSKINLSWLHIDDLCDAILKVIVSKKTKNQIINLGGEKSFSNLQLTKKIIKIQKAKLKIYKMKPSKNKIKIYRSSPNLNKIKKLTNWKSKIKLNEGIKKFFNV